MENSETNFNRDKARLLGINDPYPTMQTPLKTLESSRASYRITFLDLPRPVRDTVYRIFLRRKTSFILPRPRARTIKHYFKPSDGNGLLQRTGLYLLRTCKKVCLEGSRVLYGENTLHLAPNDVQQIEKLLGRISAGNCANIMHIVLDFERSQDNALWEAWSVSNLEFGFTQEQILGLCWRDQYQEFWTDHEERFQDILTDLLEDGSIHCSVDGGEEIRLTKLYDDSQTECLYDFDLHKGYPDWDRKYLHESIPSRDIAQMDMTRAMQSLKRCTNLRKLRLVFPDPQRYIAGWRCFVDCNELSEAFRQLVVTEEIHVEGIDDLGALGDIVDLLNVPQATATLNYSRVRPHLHVEAGRPYLRAYCNWHVIRSTWKTIQFKRIQTKEPPRDRILSLPWELVGHILNYVFSNPDGEPVHEFENGPLMSTELAGFHKRHAHIQTRGNIEVFPKSCYVFSSAFALIKVSKLFYHRAVEVLYRDSVFALRIGNHGAMLAFLTSIGESNRSKIRYLCIDWAACSRESVRYMDEETGDLFRATVDSEYSSNGESWGSSNRSNMHSLSQVFRTLKLLQCSPPFHWVLLSLPKVQTVSDFRIFSHDVLHSDRFLEACARIKVQSLWLWNTLDLHRGKLLGRSMGASAVFMQKKGLEMDEDMMRLYRRRGWKIGSWAVSKRLTATSGCTNGQIHRMGVGTGFLLDFEVYCNQNGYSYTIEY